ncbi:LOW QUALITY PROTEIN: uncharacterized protein LOC143373156 [Andrena cerasifolii]|uniref:LOW QUALITY PROTEIN: uncharacterized protein LOC143373156 n=1 Tax=Andrena cerasifolii TaxID=2819439 RepID=UPI00403844CA
MDEHRRAISLANNYFALVDGLASDLESHLLEDVVLDWIGRRIRGRRCVTAFIQAHKVSSKRMFTDVIPIFTQGDLRQGDLSNLFKLDISSTNIEETNSINRIKLKEEMAPTVKAIKRECGQGNGPPVVETSTVKYVEANGQLEFLRKFWKPGKVHNEIFSFNLIADTWDAYHLATSSVHTWRRPCKLQIAYSTLTEPPSMEPHRKSKCASRFGQSKVRLPNLEEINKISNRLAPNTSDFGGFLKHVDFFEDGQSFLQNLGIEMATEGSSESTFYPQYAKKFVFNYQIHWITHEGSNKCRMNLLSEFE